MKPIPASARCRHVLRDVARVLLALAALAAPLRAYRESRALDGQWILLHGDDVAVRELAALLGVKFKRGASGQFVHSNLISLLNLQGEIVHQRGGLKGGLDEAAAALARAAR